MSLVSLQFQYLVVSTGCHFEPVFKAEKLKMNTVPECVWKSCLVEILNRREWF